MDVLRGETPVSFYVPVKMYHENIDDLADIPGLQKRLVRKLNIFVTDLDRDVGPLVDASAQRVWGRSGGPNQRVKRIGNRA
jgi:hypothetical protein